MGREVRYFTQAFIIYARCAVGYDFKFIIWIIDIKQKLMWGLKERSWLYPDCYYKMDGENSIWSVYPQMQQQMQLCLFVCVCLSICIYAEN